MPITYAGRPLLLEDPQYRLSRWLDRTLPLSDLRLFGNGPVAYQDGRWVPRGSDRYRVGLPTANWSMPQSLRINTLWWPTGASRFAVGLFLCGQVSLDLILGSLKTDGTDGAALLVISEVETGGQTVQTMMHCLPPRPLDSPGDYGGERLHLLPLVDERYFWQFRSAGDLLFDEDDGYSWDELLDHLASQLTDNYSIEAVTGYYLAPDPTEFSRPHENAAVLMDAAAWCVGQRVTRDLEGRLWSTGPATSLYQLGANFGSPAAADPLYERSRWPSAVRVVFPRYEPWDEGASPTGVTRTTHACDAGEVFAVEVSGDAYISAPSPSVDRVKTFYDTMPAQFDAGASPSPAETADDPLNLTMLEDLAQQIAQNYYAWLDVETYDLSCPGVKAWVPTGYDDAVSWHCGRLHPRGSEDPNGEDFGTEGGAPYAFYTRVASLPADWGYSELLHFDPWEPSYSSSSIESSASESSSSSAAPTTTIWWGTLNENMSAGGTASVSIWDSDPPNALADTGDDVDADDMILPAGATAASGMWVLIQRISGRWWVTLYVNHIEVMTDYQVDTVNLTLQMKTRDILAPSGAESGWTDIHTGTACP